MLAGVIFGFLSWRTARHLYYKHTLYIIYILYVCIQLYTYLAGRPRCQKPARQQLCCSRLLLRADTITSLDFEISALNTAVVRANAAYTSEVASQVIFLAAVLGIGVLESASTTTRVSSAQNVSISSKFSQAQTYAIENYPLCTNRDVFGGVTIRISLPRVNNSSQATSPPELIPPPAIARRQMLLSSFGTDDLDYTHKSHFYRYPPMCLLRNVLNLAVSSDTSACIARKLRDIRGGIHRKVLRWRSNVFGVEPIEESLHAATSASNSSINSGETQAQAHAVDTLMARARSVMTKAHGVWDKWADALPTSRALLQEAKDTSGSAASGVKSAEALNGEGQGSNTTGSSLQLRRSIGIYGQNNVVGGILLQQHRLDLRVCFLVLLF